MGGAMGQGWLTMGGAVGQGWLIMGGAMLAFMDIRNLTSTQQRCYFEDKKISVWKESRFLH